MQTQTRHTVIAVALMLAALLTAFTMWYYAKPEEPLSTAKHASALAFVEPAKNAVAVRQEPEMTAGSIRATTSPPSPRKTSNYSPPAPDQPPLSTQYEQLKAAADAGDARAALDLHMGLDRCNWPQSLDARRTINRDYSTIPESPSAKSRVMGREAVMQSDLAILERFESITKDCQLVPAELRDRALEYLIRSADLGDAYAQTLYAQRGYPGENASATDLLAYQDRARRYRNAAVRTCTPDVVAGAAESHRVGTLGDRPDPVLAYAYAVIRDQIVFKPGQRIANGYLRGLTAAQVREGDRHAADFIARHCR